MANIFGKVAGFAVSKVFSLGSVPIKKWLYIGAAVGIVVLISSFYLTMKSTQRELTEQALVVQEQKYALEDHRKTIESMSRLQILNDKRLKELAIRQENAESARDSVHKSIVENERKLYDLQSIFHKRGRDLGELAERKAGLVERIVNNGTEDTFRCLEILTGSPLTKEEKSIVKKNPDHIFCR